MWYDRALEVKREEEAEAIRAEIVRRLNLVHACNRNPVKRAAAIELARRDVVRFFSDWLWTFDPRNADSEQMPVHLPFMLRPRQRELLRWLEDREKTRTSGLIEKTRDEGMSFTVLGFMLHRLLTVPGWTGAVGSRKQDLVDKIGDMKALIPKVRYMLYRLPPWMREAFMPGFDEKTHDAFLKLINPHTEGSITGEAGDEMGRGGRASLYFVDEWAFIPRAKKVNAAISQNSDVRIKGSTPNGVGNLMYVERHSGRFAVFSMRWQENPAKAWLARNPHTGEMESPWYAKQTDELDPVTLAQEVDIDYAASAEGVLLPAKWVRAAIRYGLETDLELAAVGPRVSAGDLSEGGKDETVLANRTGPVVGRVEAIRSGADWQQASTIKDRCQEDGADVFRYDRLGIGAGITATLARQAADEEDAIERGENPDGSGLGFRVVGVANSEKPTDRVFEDQPRDRQPARNTERFSNRAAEVGWGLRLRFKRTWQRVTQGADIPDDECISIPNHPTLIAHLSQPQYHKNSKDKIVVDKHGEGTSSPDFYEAILYLFWPDTELPGVAFGFGSDADEDAAYADLEDDDWGDEEYI